MLDAHPDLAIPPETRFLPLAVEAANDAPDPAMAFAGAVTSYRHWRDFHIDDVTLRDRIAVIEPFDAGTALRAIYALYSERFAKPRWGDKTPHHVRRMDLIARLLPEARFIHLIRDGRDVTLSVIQERALSGRTAGAAEVARRWARSVAAARRQASALRFYLEIRYEDLVLDTEATLRAVCDFIELPWDPRMLSYHEGSAARLSELVTADPARASSAEQRRQKHVWTARPPEAGRVGRWRSEMSASDARIVAAAAGEMLRALGYDRG
jgi:Sulfotransferase family